MDDRLTSRRRSQRPYMVAMVLGTALSAFGPMQVQAAQSSQATLEAIRDMGRYCTTCWRNARLPADAWSDCTQEVFRRLLERVPAERWGLVLHSDGEDRREFVRAIDTVKKRTQRAHKWSAAIEAVADPHEGQDRLLREEREVVRQAAAELLSHRQQRILQLSFEGWSVQDMAREMALPVERVSDEKYKAIRKLRAHLGSVDPNREPVSSFSA